MSQVLSLRDVVGVATQAFQLFGGGRSDIRSTGLGPVDRAIGGLFPGAVGVVAADTGVGKTSLALHAAMASPHVVGIVSAEDGPDVLGSRALAMHSRIDALSMRRPKERLSENDITHLESSARMLGEREDLLFSFPAKKSHKGMRDAVRALIDAGVEFVWLDYLQKFRGLTGDRRNEVGATLTYFQEECQEGGVPGLALSQFRRRDMTRPPMLGDMKESGDIENECRLAVLAWCDVADTALVNCRIAKSAYGAGGLRFQYRRTNIGTLEEVTHDNVEF